MRPGVLVPVGTVHVVAQVGLAVANPVDEALVSSEFAESINRDLPEHPHRVGIDAFPQSWVDGSEQIAGGLVPRPTQVVRKFT